MLTLLDSTDRIRLVTNFYYQPIYDFGRTGNIYDIGNTSDRFYLDTLQSVAMRVEFQSPKISAMDILGQEHSATAEQSYSIYGFAPGNQDMPSKLGKLHEIGDVLRFLSAALKKAPSIATPDSGPIRENAIGHINIVGHAEVGATFAGVGGIDAARYGRIARNPESLSGYSLDYSISGNYPSHVWSQFHHDHLVSAKSEIPAGNYDGYFYPDIYCSVKNLNIAYDGDRVTHFWYDVVNARTSDGDGITPWFWYKECRVSWGVTWFPRDTTPVDSAFFYERYCGDLVKSVVCTKQYVRGHGEAPVWYLNPVYIGSNPYSWPNKTTISQPWCWSGYTYPARGFESYTGITGPKGACKSDTGPRSLVAFRRNVNQITDDLLVMGFLAQGNAWDENMVLLKSNILEFFVELGDIASLVASPLQMVNAAGKVFRGGTLGSSLKNFLSLAADAKLYYSFMASPTVRLADEVAEKATALLQICDSVFGWRTINGKAVYIIDEEFPTFAGNVVIGRSKMRVRIPEDSWLPVVLPLEQLNLLPSLSRTWETMWLSFAVDWFFNIKSKLDVIDKTMRFMALDVAYVTNSVTLYQPIVPTPTEFLVADETSYKYYCRWTLPQSQVFTPTRLDVLGAQGVPDWLTAGALFYKLS